MRHAEAWVAWTPDGRYDGSPDGVALLVAWRVGARALPLDRSPARRVAGLLGLVMQGK